MPWLSNTLLILLKCFGFILLGGGRFASSHVLSSIWNCTTQPNTHPKRAHDPCDHTNNYEANTPMPVSSAGSFTVNTGLKVLEKGTTPIVKPAIDAIEGFLSEARMEIKLTGGNPIRKFDR